MTARRRLALMRWPITGISSRSSAAAIRSSCSISSARWPRRFGRRPRDDRGADRFPRRQLLLAVIRFDPTSPLEFAQVRPEVGEFSPMWEIYPPGIQELLEMVWRDYRPPSILITENGMPHADVVDAGGQVNDAARISYLERHLARIQASAGRGNPHQWLLRLVASGQLQWGAGLRHAFRAGVCRFPEPAADPEGAQPSFPSTGPHAVVTVCGLRCSLLRCTASRRTPRVVVSRKRTSSSAGSAEPLRPPGRSTARPAGSSS